MARKSKRRAPTKAKATKRKRRTPTTKRATKLSKAERESIALGELERKRVERAHRKKIERQRQRRAEQRAAEKIAAELEAGSIGKRELNERDLAIGWLESMAPVGWSMQLVEPEVAARIPWIAVGKFTPQGEIGYAELGDVFRLWRNDLLLEAKIHPQRISQIRIVYEDPDDKRGAGDSIVSHTGPWELVVSEAASEMDPDNPDSLAARYKGTGVPHFYVYFSSELAKSSTWLPSYQRPD